MKNFVFIEQSVKKNIRVIKYFFICSVLTVDIIWPFESFIAPATAYHQKDRVHRQHGEHFAAVAAVTPESAAGANTNDNKTAATSLILLPLGC